MSKRTLSSLLSVAALAVGVAACGSSGSASGGATAAASGGPKASPNLPTVTMMVGGIDKQIYLPYQLAQDLGYFKKYGVNMKLSTEQAGGVGAETAMVSGQVDLAGAWYVHTIDFQQQGKNVVDLVQLSGAPGEREMCQKGSSVTSPGQWKGKAVGVTDIGSGTDNLTRYLAARAHLTTAQYTRAAVGDGSSFLAALQHGRIVCGMTTQPTVNAIETKGVGYSAINLASTADAVKALGGVYPAAGVLARSDWVNSHKAVAQKVVDAMVATMHWIATHSAADIAAHMPHAYVVNGLTTQASYIKTLAQDKSQFLPNGMMPASGPATALAIDKFAGNVHKSITLGTTWTNAYAAAANKLEGYTP
jgi:sulfonate transport system substrate-binding protein